MPTERRERRAPTLRGEQEGGWYASAAAELPTPEANQTIGLTSAEPVALVRFESESGNVKYAESSSR